MIKCKNPCPIDKFEGCCYECDLKETCIEVCGFNPFECDDSIMMNDMFQVDYLKEKKKKEELVVEKQPDKMQTIKTLIKAIKRLFCYHKWVMIGNPYLWEGGTTKRVDVRCVKCNKLYNVDIFDTPKRRWYEEK